MIFTRLTYLFLFLFSFLLLDAQEKASIKATLDKNKILIGEPVLLTIEATIPQNSSYQFNGIDSIPHFEFLETKTDTIPSENGVIIKGVYKITSFDSGHWVIPSIVLAKGISTDTLPVDVVFSDFDPTRDYHDIKDIIEVEVKEKKEWWYAAAGALLLLALLIWALLRKKKPKPVVQKEITVDPYNEAMSGLQELEKKQTRVKEFYSELVSIFRLYIFRKKGILSLQKTTDDLVIQLKSLDLTKEQFQQLSQALQLSDFVKFAKYVPAESDNKTVFDTIKKAIEIIEKKDAV